MKKILAILLTVALLVNSMNLTISAEDSKRTLNEASKNFVDLLMEDKYDEALRYRAIEVIGEDDSPRKHLLGEELECFQKRENIVFTVNVEYYDSVFDWHILDYYSEEYMKESTATFSVYTSDYKIYTYTPNIYVRNTFTVDEIIKGCGIPDSSKIIFIECGYHACFDITSFDFHEYTTGWNTINGADYYINPDGTLQTKSCSIDGIRYSFSSNGVCKGRYTGWTKSSKGRRYYKNGELVKNKWLKTKSGKRYYAGAEGYMRTGWAMIKEKGICFFDENGIWDGKKHYIGYQPNTMADFLMDFDFSPELEYEYNINYKYKFRKFEGIEKVIEILEKDKDKSFIYDELVEDDLVYINENIYHGDDDIIISTKSHNGVLIFSKDEEGNSYFYCSYYGFGCKLSDKDAFDKVKELIS